jgi:hypothetical protein
MASIDASPTKGFQGINLDYLVGRAVPNIYAAATLKECQFLGSRLFIPNPIATQSIT